MPLSERAPPLDPDGDLPPLIRTPPPGAMSRGLSARIDRVESPAFGARRHTRESASAVEMGPIVYAQGKGSNVLDVDGNRYVDLAAGFGALLLGHRHPRVARALEAQAERLWMALGDLYPSDAKAALLDKLAALYPHKGARVLLGQSGSDAVSAALKTARLATGKPGIVAFDGAYHGLGYGPLAACGLRSSWREAFADQLNAHVTFVPYPRAGDEGNELERSLLKVREALLRGNVGAILVEPLLGRGGCQIPPSEFWGELFREAERAGVLVIADEIWTGLGRCGAWLASVDSAPSAKPVAHLICLGKGLGGGLPVSACIGPDEIMQAWRRDPGHEVVHTATFHGAPLGCATALATLEVLRAERLVERSALVGGRLRDRIERLFIERGSNVRVRGAGLMIGIDWRESSLGLKMSRALLERGYITTNGGTNGEVTILTPPLTIAEPVLDAFVDEVAGLLDARASS